MILRQESLYRQVSDNTINCIDNSKGTGPSVMAKAGSGSCQLPNASVSAAATATLCSVLQSGEAKCLPSVTF